MLALKANRHIDVGRHIEGAIRQFLDLAAQLGYFGGFRLPEAS